MVEGGVRGERVEEIEGGETGGGRWGGGGREEGGEIVLRAAY